MSQKQLLFGCFIIQIVLLVAAIVLAKQRMFIADSSEFLIELINSGTFNTPHKRFIASFSQFLPLLGIKLSLPIIYVAVLYSLNVQLIYFLAFYISLKSKHNIFAIFITLFQIVISSYSYFLPISELGFGVCFLVLNIVLLEKMGYSSLKIKYFVSLIFCFFIVTAHPLMLVIFAVFVMSYTLKQFPYGYITNSNFKILSASFFVMCIVGLLFISRYEKHQIFRITDLNFNMGFIFAKLQSLLDNWISYIASFLFFVFLMFGLFRNKNKKYLLSSIFVILSCFLFVVIYINYTPLYMSFFEIYLFPISFLLSLICCQLLISKNTASRIHMFILTFLIVQIGVVFLHLKIYNKHINNTAEIVLQMKDQGVNKAVFPYSSYFNTEILDFSPIFSNSSESLLLSNYMFNQSYLYSFIYDVDVELSEVNVFKDYTFKDFNMGFEKITRIPIENYSKKYFNLRLDEDYNTFELIE